MDLKLKKLEERMDKLSLIFSLVANVQISGEKSVINYVTTHIYESFIKDLREEMVTKQEFEKLFISSNLAGVEIEMLKDQQTDMGDKIIGLKHEAVTLRDMINDRLETQQFLGIMLIQT